MGFFSSLTEKLYNTFSASERKTKAPQKNVVDIKEHIPPRPTGTETEIEQLTDGSTVISIDRSLNAATGEKTPRQESARRLNEIFAEVKNIKEQERILDTSRWGDGLRGELKKDLCTTVHGNLLRLTLLGEATYLTHQVVQSELFSHLLGPVTPVAAVLATTLIARESIKTISEVVDYYFRGGRSQRKLLEQERQQVQKLRGERKLAARHYREGIMSAEEYIHYAADLAKKVCTAEEAVLNGRPKNSEPASEPQFPAKKTKEILGEKKLIEQERGRAMARSIVSTVAAPIVSVLNGLPLGFNEWDGHAPAHTVVTSLQGVRYYSEGIARAFSPVPGQALTALAIGATGLIGKAVEEIYSFHKRFKPESKADAALQSMEKSLERIRQCQEDIQGIANTTPSPGKNLNVEQIEILRRPTPYAAPKDFSDLAEAVARDDAKKAAAEARKAARGPSLLDKVLGRATRPLGMPVETTPLTAQDFGESPSLFRAETVRKALGVNVLPGTLLTQEGFMDQLEKWIENASDIEIIDRELYFSDQQHKHTDGDVDENSITALDEAARRCAAERLHRVAEKMPIATFDPNAVRARLLVLIGMEDEVAVGQKYFEKLFAQGYADASRIQRTYFNSVLSALDLSTNVNDVSRKREKNIIFESVRAVIGSYENAQSEAA
ncbi:MAG: hypothetical protein AAB400_03565 [Patescibacteria group bacterium]